MKGTETLFENFKPRVSVIITGEQVNLDSDLQTLGSFAQLEADPVRRSAILELMARKKGLDFGSLPKSPNATNETNANKRNRYGWSRKYDIMKKKNL